MRSPRCGNLRYPLTAPNPRPTSNRAHSRYRGTLSWRVAPEGTSMPARTSAGDPVRRSSCGLARIPMAAVPAPAVGVLAWWSVALAAPVVLVWRRRHCCRRISPRSRRRLLRRRPHEPRPQRAAETTSEIPAAPERASNPSHERVEIPPPSQAVAHRSQAAVSGAATSPLPRRSRDTTAMPGRVSPETLEPLSPAHIDRTPDVVLGRRTRRLLSAPGCSGATSSSRG